jgi:transcriptional regulator of acetoin/glycerol metabolism
MRYAAKERNAAANRPGSGYRDRHMAHLPKTRKPAQKAQGGPRTYGRLQRALDDAAGREIRAALKETGEQVVAAATLLGISKVALWKRMRALGIKAQP